MNYSWFLFYGRKLGMDKKEINVTLYREMVDMINCLNIERGAVEYKAPPKKMSLAEVMKLR